MTDALWLIPAALAGVACGAGFFGGLWWTIQRGLPSRHAAWWFIGSMLIRSGVVIAVFVWIAQGDAKRALACAGGFFVARVTAQVLSRVPRPARPPAKLIAEGSP